MKPTPSITIWKDAEALSTAAAYFFVDACKRSILEKGSFIVALSGGSTPKRLYQLLATPAFGKNIDWTRVFLFWSDERFVPHTDSESNYRMVKESLLDHIDIPRDNIFAIPTDGTPKDDAKKYEAAIRACFKKKAAFDWLLLGTGDDGHTASLFPGTKVLEENKKLVAAVWVEKKQTWRISFTYSLINKAKHVIFLVAGKEKSAVVSHILRGEKPPMPAQLVSPAKGLLYWMLDEAAAAGLS